jgi:HEAT repeat protein
MILLFALLACSPSAEDIATAIHSENPVMREDGAKIAQNYDDEVVVKALLDVIGDPSEKVRLNAIESLAELQAQDAGPALIERLQNDPSPAVQRAAADALGRIIYKDAVPALVAYAQAFPPDDRGQLVAIWAIGRIGYEGMQPDVRKVAMAFLVERRALARDRYVLHNIAASLRFMR